MKHQTTHEKDIDETYKRIIIVVAAGACSFLILSFAAALVIGVSAALLPFAIFTAVTIGLGVFIGAIIPANKHARSVGLNSVNTRLRSTSQTGAEAGSPAPLDDNNPAETRRVVPGRK